MRHPLDRSSRVVRDLFRYMRPRKLEYVEQPLGTPPVSKPVADALPHEVIAISQKDGDLRLSLAWQNGEIILAPVFDNAPREPASSAVMLQGAFQQDNSYGCIEVHFDPRTGQGTGKIWDLTPRSRWGMAISRSALWTAAIPIKLRAVARPE